MKNRTNIRWLTQLALLVAVLLVMNYTPLGYLQVGPLSMSLLTIPVAIGAMTLGPVAGAILGGVPAGERVSRARERVVGGGDAGADLGDEHDDVGRVDGELRLLAHEEQDLIVGARLDAAGIDDIERAAAPLSLIHI